MKESQLHARVSQDALSKLSKMAPHRKKGAFVDWLIRKEYRKREKRGELVPSNNDSSGNCTLNCATIDPASPELLMPDTA